LRRRESSQIGEPRDDLAEFRKQRRSRPTAVRTCPQKIVSSFDWTPRATQSTRYVKDIGEIVGREFASEGVRSGD